MIDARAGRVHEFLHDFCRLSALKTVLTCGVGQGAMSGLCKDDKNVRIFNSSSFGCVQESFFGIWWGTVVIGC